MELTDWQPLSDRGPDLVLCLDFPGGRAEAGFAELAAAVPVDACFLHIGHSGFAGVESLDTGVARWVAQARSTGRPVRAVLGYCAGAALATGVADAVAATGPPPVVLLFDAVATAGGSLCGEFIAAVESSAGHLTADELDGARLLAEELLESRPDDLPGLAAELRDRYDRLMGAVAQRLSLNEFFRQELTRGFTAYLDYLLLASQGRFELRDATPLFLSSKDHEPPADGVRNISLDAGHTELLRDAEVHKLVAGLLRGEQQW
ncbi:hypothetical protein [Actinophytocola sp.]|uniref:hypothetical protein n=1 Tax=Actinophytocola sp. TaxID=1872138 RepID=UPI002D7F4CA3|nr:hypothetical protein [Actinophytocola sp.]HET9143121.1 hypothetical protein [Actinophytocola sp.]